MRLALPGTLVFAALIGGCASPPPDALVTKEHRVDVVSSAPGFAGQRGQLYLREVIGAMARWLYANGRPLPPFVQPLLAQE